MQFYKWKKKHPYEQPVLFCCNSGIHSYLHKEKKHKFMNIKAQFYKW